ncbi:MAG: DUF262 domain-containing protein [Micrococcales bacterium]|nr:DUF262 domain-containing protein [Micrococcales bacterium]
METSVSKVDQWQIGEIGEAYKENGTGGFYIRVPKFQRSEVWNMDDRRGLIDSLYRGFPIGAILGYKTSDTKGNRTVVQIVDGLQRTSTIAKYLEEPLTYAPVDRVFDGTLVELISSAAGLEISDDSKDKVLRHLESWLREVKQAVYDENFNSQKLAAHLAKKLEVELSVFDSIIHEINKELGEVITRVLAVKAISIPVVLYSGNVENIALIFERINNQGMQLTKYQILASSWVDSQTRITNGEIREAIAQKYKVMQDKGYEIEGLSENSQIDVDDYNLYEYLFGFSKVLSQKAPLLFGESAEADEINPAAFVLVTNAVGLRNAKMGSLAKRLKDQAADSGPIDLEKLESAIFKSVEAINNRLKPYLVIKMHKNSNKATIAHSQNQIISLISAYLVNAFDIYTWQAKSRSDLKLAEAIQKNAPSYYLMDIIEERWRGSGDSKLFALTWADENVNEESRATQPSSHYATAITKTDFEKALMDWHDEQLSKKQRERSNLAPGTQIVLKFLYSNLVSVMADQMDEYELEHLYPVSVLKSHIADMPEGWPISALGNLTLLPKGINRIKGKNMLGDFLPKLKLENNITELEIEKIQNYLIVPEIWEIRESTLGSKESYETFCRLRMKAIASQIVANLEL